jgi:DMSO/TMAO reductase YedYZ heme-binding membrane subunit
VLQLFYRETDMSLVIALTVSIALAFAIAKPLKRMPIIFYLIAIAVSVVGVYLTWYPDSNQLLRTFAFAVQKGHVGFSFFTIVMFIGVFAKKSRVRRLLGPVRGELSIVSALLIIGHLMPYLLSYLVMALDIVRFPPGIVVSILTALVLLILLVILTATSFNRVKRHIDSSRWITLQKLAYLFFALVFVHMLGFLIGPLMHGSLYALINVAVYFLIFALYLITRLRRARLDAKEK